MSHTVNAVGEEDLPLADYRRRSRIKLRRCRDPAEEDGALGTDPMEFSGRRHPPCAGSPRRAGETFESAQVPEGEGPTHQVQAFRGRMDAARAALEGP